MTAPVPPRRRWTSPLVETCSDEDSLELRQQRPDIREFVDRRVVLGGPEVGSNGARIVQDGPFRQLFDTGRG